MIKKIYLLLLIIVLSSCSSVQPLKIAISKGAGSETYDRYGAWLKQDNPEIETIDLYYTSLGKALTILDNCDGLILSGGPDVHPARFGMPNDTALCTIDLKRDTLEFALIKKALEKKIPILAICRGAQIINIALGGNLIIDIPSMKPSDIKHQCQDKNNCFHNINIMPLTTLSSLTTNTIETVNTNHHQGIGKLAPELKATAFSADSIVEALEWINPDNKSFLIGVQWHPERMDTKASLSGRILNLFLNNVQAFRNQKKESNFSKADAP